MERKPYGPSRWSPAGPTVEVFDRNRDRFPARQGEPKEEIDVMFWYDHDISAWGWIGMSIGMVVFWAVVIGAIVWLVRSVSRDDRQVRTPHPTPEQLLAERFARGEIDETEYRDRLAALRGERRPAVTS